MNKENLPFVSVIIPCRNEEKYIGKCLDSVLVQEYPKNKMEVLVIDGASSDKTRDIINNYVEKFSFIKLLDNPDKVVPFALNIGVKASSGDFIIRLDAHSWYPGNYISDSINNIIKYGVDNVGGLWITLPASGSLAAKGIVCALTSEFGVGKAYYRIGLQEPKLVDTVPFGCYKKEVFSKIGLFDEDLIRNQDDEFNMRLIKNGGKILLVPDIVCYYYARDSYNKLWKMYYQYGYFKPLVVKKIGGVMTIRQLVPFLFVCSFVILPLFSVLVWKKFIYLWYLELFMYFTANLYFSLKCAIKNNIKLLPFIMWAFIVIHFGYGYGYIRGIVDFMIFNKRNLSNKKDIPLTR